MAVIKRALSHFGVVGLGFAFVLGWVATLLVNGVLGMVLNSVVGTPPNRSYLGALLLTVISLALITGATVLGNRAYRKWFGERLFFGGPLLVSSALFASLVLWRTAPELQSATAIASSRTSYFYNHSWELVGLFSLPLLRAIGLPVMYLLVSRRKGAKVGEGIVLAPKEADVGGA